MSDHAADRTGDGEDSHHEAHAHDAADGEDIHGHEVQNLGRVTSPMQGYSTRDAGVGFLVLAVGVAVAYAVPFLLA